MGTFIQFRKSKPLPQTQEKKMTTKCIVGKIVFTAATLSLHFSMPYKYGLTFLFLGEFSGKNGKISKNPELHSLATHLERKIKQFKIDSVNLKKEFHRCVHRNQIYK